MITASLRSVNLAERTRLLPQVARTYALLGLVAGTSGAGGLARTYFREARRVAETSRDEPGLTYALYAEASFTLGIGDLPTTKRLALEALAVGERVGDVQELEVVRTILTHVEHYTGELRQAEKSFLEIRDSARRRESLQHDLWGTYGSARSLIPLGRLDEAVERLVAAQAMLARVPDHGSAVIVHGLLARAHLLSGERAPAKAAADEALRLLSQSMASVFETYRGYSHAAEVYLELAASAAVAGERARAMAVARRALKDLGAFAFRFPLARPARHLVEGRALEVQGRAGKARRAFEAARDTARRLTMPYEEAQAHAALARLSPAGSLERAEGAAYARSLFSRLGCPRDLADLEATLEE
jgi:tetratricopeptide (TPR) repeat protein